MLKKVYLILIFFLFFLYPQKVFAGNIVINEVVVHPASGNDEWVEIYNPDNTDLTGYFIDDDTNFTDDIGSSKKQLTTITAGTYGIFVLSSSVFNNSGDLVVLFDQNGNIIDQYEYTDDPGTDAALGRSPDGNGSFTELASATQGGTNSGVLPTATLTPTQIPTPTRTPTPTKTPTPSKIQNPTVTKTPTLVPTKKNCPNNPTCYFENLRKQKGECRSVSDCCFRNKCFSDSYFSRTV